MNRLIKVLTFLLVALVASAYVIKETKSNEDLDLYVSPGGTPTKALSIGGASGATTVDGSTDSVQLNVKGHTTQTNNVSPLIQAQGGGAYAPEVRITRSATDVDSPSAPVSGNTVGLYSFRAYDGDSYEETASIKSFVDGTPGNGDMPGRLVLFTTPDGSTTPAERMRIDSAGNVGIGTTTTSAKLTVSGSISTNGAVITTASDSPGFGVVARSYLTGVGVNQSAISLNSSAANQGQYVDVSWGNQAGLLLLGTGGGPTCFFAIGNAGSPTVTELADESNTCTPSNANASVRVFRSTQNGNIRIRNCVGGLVTVSLFFIGPQATGSAAAQGLSTDPC